MKNQSQFIISRNESLVNQQRKEESCILAELRWVSLMNIVTANKKGDVSRKIRSSITMVNFIYSYFLIHWYYGLPKKYFYVKRERKQPQNSKTTHPAQHFSSTP